MWCHRHCSMFSATWGPIWLTMFKSFIPQCVVAITLYAECDKLLLLVHFKPSIFPLASAMYHCLLQFILKYLQKHIHRVDRLILSFFSIHVSCTLQDCSKNLKGPQYRADDFYGDEPLLLSAHRPSSAQYLIIWLQSPVCGKDFYHKELQASSKV